MKDAGPRQNEKDNRRAFRWGVAAIVVLILAVVAYNLMSYQRAGPVTHSPAPEQQAPAKPPGS